MANYQQQMLGKGVRKMPKVGDKEFDYTPEGVAAAKKESVDTGIPMSDGSMRSVQEYAGGGKVGYARIGVDPIGVDPIPEPEYRGQTFDRYAQEWKDGGDVDKKSWKDKMKDKLKNIKLTKTQVGYDSEGKRVERKVDVSLKKKKKKTKKEKEVLKTKKAIKKVKDVKIAKGADETKLQDTGKIRQPKKVASVTRTEGGAYPTYKKKSKPAKSFRKAFAEARSADKKTFMWDGRKYTTEVKK